MLSMHKQGDNFWSAPTGVYWTKLKIAGLWRRCLMDAPMLGSSSFNAHALGALAEVAGPGLSSHIGTILPTLVLAMDNEDEDVQSTAIKAAETVVLVIDDEGVETLIPELLSR